MLSTASVQPGIRNLAISEAARAFGLFYAPDPSSQAACSIGGNVAENAGGVHCLKYGLTVNNLAALEVVTMDGAVLRLGGESLDWPGFDLDGADGPDREGLTRHHHRGHQRPPPARTGACARPSGRSLRRGA